MGRERLLRHEDGKPRSSFSQTKTILNGVNMPNVQFDDIQAILNMRDAWRFLMGSIDEPLKQFLYDHAIQGLDL